MKNIKKLIAIAVSAGLVFSFAGCGLVSKTPEGIKKEAVASVNGQDITKGDVEERLAPQLTQISQMYGKDIFTKQPDLMNQLKERTLESMVQEQVIVQKAKELKIAFDENELAKDVNSKYQDQLKQAGGDAKFSATLKSAGYTVDQYKEVLRTQVIEQKMYDYVTKDASVTDQDINNYYQQHLYDYTEKPNTMNVSHILVKTEAEALKVKKELDAGGDFAALAKKYSQDPGSKDKGGNLGDIAYNDKNYVAEFMAGAIATPQGKVSMPIKSQYGYHLIKINSKKEYKVKPLEAVKAEIKNTLVEQKKSDMFQAAYDTWKSKAKIEEHTDKL